MELVSQYRLRITAQADIIRTQQDEIERLTRELADSQEQKDLLEFQCIEMRQAAEAERCARSVSRVRELDILNVCPKMLGGSQKLKER